MLYKSNETGKLKLIVAVYVDNVSISGKEKEICKFKTTFNQTYKITDLGKLKSHLYIWYEWIRNEEGSTMKMHMDNIAKKIIKQYEVGLLFLFMPAWPPAQRRKCSGSTGKI